MRKQCATILLILPPPMRSSGKQLYSIHYKKFLDTNTTRRGSNLMYENFKEGDSTAKIENVLFLLQPGDVFENIFKDVLFFTSFSHYMEGVDQCMIPCQSFQCSRQRKTDMARVVVLHIFRRIWVENMIPWPNRAPLAHSILAHCNSTLQTPFDLQDPESSVGAAWITSFS